MGPLKTEITADEVWDVVSLSERLAAHYEELVTFINHVLADREVTLDEAYGVLERAQQGQAKAQRLVIEAHEARVAANEALHASKLMDWAARGQGFPANRHQIENILGPVGIGPLPVPHNVTPLFPEPANVVRISERE